VHVHHQQAFLLFAHARQGRRRHALGRDHQGIARFHPQVGQADFIDVRTPARHRDHQRLGSARKEDVREVVILQVGGIPGQQLAAAAIAQVGRFITGPLAVGVFGHDQSL
jgi:hypothetical protein